MRQRSLKLSDLHVHTNFAYCGADVTPVENIIRAKEHNLYRIAFTEHSGQLYVNNDDYWSGRFVNEPELLYRNSATPLNRMRSYRKEMEKFRSDVVLVGLETEVDCNGNLILLEEDRNGWDILLGAVHYLPRKFEVGSKIGFMWANEALMRHGVQILAHPFRYFFRNGLLCPKELYIPIAELLAQYGAAVELNYHTNENDAEFFKICLEHHVLISLGSDAHNLAEIGEFKKHLELLDRLLPPDKIQDKLFI